MSSMQLGLHAFSLVYANKNLLIYTALLVHNCQDAHALGPVLVLAAAEPAKGPQPRQDQLRDQLLRQPRGQPKAPAAARAMPLTFARPLWNLE